MRLLPLLLAALVGCADKAEDTFPGGGSTTPADDTGEDIVDADGDGYGAEEDCDDDNPDINPGADEVCDYVDNNCDGEVDEGVLLTFYADEDSDGYGNEFVPEITCTLEDGFVDNSDDCDDEDADISPGADEECDGIDNDCDDAIDENTAVDAETWYYDGDGDGYGFETISTDACEAPSGYVASADDCDDTDAAYNPGAEEDCTDPNDYNCDGSVGYADDDGDGFAACEDCDDSDAAVNDDGTELCDGIDNDCDGDTDEDDAADGDIFYADTDGDGFGTASSTTTACSAPAGYVEDLTDCNDTDATVNPDADEECDEVDNNCDGTIDEDTATDAATWYADTDSDGYGDPGSTDTACSAPSGYVSDDSDCDDGNGSVNPDGEEVCDEVDNDCDGSIDDYDADVTDATTWYRDLDGDGYGFDAYSLDACDQPSNYVEDNTDCDDSDSDAYPGAEETCDNTDNDCDGETDEADATDAGTFYADTDGDGYGDASSTQDACTEPSGYVLSDGDCDDSNADINPDVPEQCDGADNDCDGDTDEADAVDAQTFYADSDEDGYGAASATQDACTAPSGYVSDDTDCDDGDGSVYPGAAEVCDEIDNDCDENIDDDDGDLDLDSATVFYEDDDGDGYGSDTIFLSACEQPSGYLTTGGDCDDSTALISPDATEECDGIDNDCDGDIDDDDSNVDLTNTGNTFYADTDEDGYGDPDSTTTACDEPSGYTIDATDCNDSDGTIYPGSPDEVLHDGVDQDCDEFDGYTIDDLAVGDLIITEIMVNPAEVSDDYGEYFEVYNNFGDDVDLNGLEYSDNADTDTISETTVLPADGYFVFGVESDTSLNGGVDVDVDWAGLALSNSGDIITLVAGTTTIDEVDYASFSISAGDALSLSPGLDATDNDDEASWCEASSTYGDGDYGTPGFENDICPE